MAGDHGQLQGSSEDGSDDEGADGVVGDPSTRTPVNCINLLRCSMQVTLTWVWTTSAGCRVGSKSPRGGSLCVAFRKLVVLICQCSCAAGPQCAANVLGGLLHGAKLLDRPSKLACRHHLVLPAAPRRAHAFRALLSGRAHCAEVLPQCPHQGVELRLAWHDEGESTVKGRPSMVPVCTAATSAQIGQLGDVPAWLTVEGRKLCQSCRRS